LPVRRRSGRTPDSFAQPRCQAGDGQQIDEPSNDLGQVPPFHPGDP
jgi:hypothetical protein